MLAEQTGSLLVQFADLLVEQPTFLQRHLQQPPIDVVQLRTGAESSLNCSGVARKRSSAKAAKAAGLVSPSARAFNIRRALKPSKSETKLDNLIWASSRRDSNWFCNRIRARLNWNFLRVTVRHRRCSASGTKLRVSSRATSRFTRRSASTKSLLRPRRPRLDSACARCNLPDLRFAPSRFSHKGFQYLSSASHTGFQYCAVDSMTTSSTSRSTSQAANARSCSGLLPNIRRSNWNSASTSTSDTTIAMLFPVNLGLLAFSPDGQLGLLLTVMAIQMMSLGDTPLGQFKRSWLIIIVGLVFAALEDIVCVIVPGLLTGMIQMLLGLLNAIGGAALLVKRYLPTLQEIRTPPAALIVVPPDVRKMAATQTALNCVAIAFGVAMLVPGLVPGLLLRESWS